MLITEHAEDRVGIRLGLSNASAARLAATAWEYGIRARDVSGAFRRWFDAQEIAHKRPLRVYGEHVYVFAEEGKVLVTVMHLRNEFKQAAKKQLARRWERMQKRTT